MSRRLIMKADDYGRTPGVSAGIRYAHLHGIVTSTSALMTRPGIAADLKLAQEECPQLEIGVHLIVTSGPSMLPPEQIPSLTGGTPGFRGLLEMTADLQNIVVEEVQAELRAQVQQFVNITGKAPGHLDSHHHFSYFREDLFETVAILAAEYQCPIRMQLPPPGCQIGGVPEHLLPDMFRYMPRLAAQYRIRFPDYFYDGWYDEQATRAEFLRAAAALPSGTTEMMCHPGYVDEGLMDAVDGSVYSRQRESELGILTDPTVKAFLKQQEIALINFDQL